jgi:hypothetical protein
MAFRRSGVRTPSAPPSKASSSLFLGVVVIGAIRIQTVLAVIVIINLIGLTIAAFIIMRKK